MTPLLRSLWLAAHRWLALTLGTLLAGVALLGTLLTVARPLDQWQHPQLFVQPAGMAAAARPLGAAQARLRAEFGPGTAFTFRPPRLAGDTLWVFVRGPWEGVVYFDAAGRELGRRGEHEGWFNLLFELHASLLAGDRGKAVLAAAAAAYLVLLATGLVLWWPRRWPPSLRVQRGAGWLRTVFDLHKLTGALLGLVLAVPVASGAYMAWPPLRAAISALAGQQAVVAPPVRPAASAAPAGSLDAMVEAARSRVPHAMVGYVHVPAQPTQPVRVRLKAADDPHPNGLSSVWLDPASGQVLQVTNWKELDVGQRIVTTVYPLHIGVLGGPAHTLLTALSGLALATLAVTGLALWWQRRRLRARRGLPTTARRAA